MKSFFMRTVGCVAAAVAFQAGSQELSRPLALVVPYQAGGGADIFGRALQAKLSEELRQPVVIELRPGGATSLGAAAVARAAPDGHTLLLTSVPTHVLPGLTRTDLSYHPLNSFASVALLAVGLPNYVIASSQIGFSSVQDLLAAARAKPGSVTYSSSGQGSTTHLAMELFSSMTGAKLLHVPYKGSSPAMIAVASGEVNVGVIDGATATTLQGSKVRFLGVMARERSSRFPDVPTFAESGFAGLEVSAATMMLLAPASTPRALVERISGAVRATLSAPEVIKRLDSQGWAATFGSPDEATRLVVRNLEQFGRIVKDLGLSDR